jgi:HNH endonuclease
MEHGDPLFTKYASTETKLKFINDVVLSCENLECLIWPFSRRDGRGYINEEPVSRFVCKLAHGSPPTEKHDAAHNCGNERCVNPHHLRWATRKDNMADRDRHGTDQRGEKAYNAILATADVKMIRAVARFLRTTRRSPIFMVPRRGRWRGRSRQTPRSS